MLVPPRWVPAARNLSTSSSFICSTSRPPDIVTTFPKLRVIWKSCRKKMRQVRCYIKVGKQRMVAVGTEGSLWLRSLSNSSHGAVALLMLAKTRPDHSGTLPTPEHRHQTESGFNCVLNNCQCCNAYNYLVYLYRHATASVSKHRIYNY